MARIGHRLLWLLLLGSSNAWACFCTTPTMVAPDGRNYCIANPECWACVPGAYDPNWQALFCGNYVPPAPTCQPSSITEQRSCPANFSGTEVWQKDTTCVSNQPVEGSWYKAGDTCTPNPPSCQPSSESQSGSCPVNTSGTVVSIRQSTCPDPYGQPVWGEWQQQGTCTPNPPTCSTGAESRTESCQAGFVGQKDYTRQSICSDPYGQAIWGQWNLVSDSCTKSVTNPTNPLSPVSPISAPAMSSAPVIAPPPAPMMTEMPAEAPAESAPASEPKTDSTPSAAPSQAQPAQTQSAGSGARAVALVQRLTLIGALPPQPTIIETLTLAQELPDDIRRQQDLLIVLFNITGVDKDLLTEQQQTFEAIMFTNPMQRGAYE